MNTNISTSTAHIHVSFADAVKAGTTKLSDVDDWVEDWHKGEGQGMTLRDYLGLSTEIYSAWLKRSDALLALTV